MTSTELARTESRIPRKSEIEDLTALGNLLGKSGFFKDVQSGYQAVAKLMFGRDLGLSATAAMTGVHIIEGKPEISANLQAQMVRSYVGPEGERYKYLVREHDNQHCKVEFFRRERALGEWESIGFSEYTMQDAATAGLAGKSTWKKHPRNMLFARAMSDGVAFHCPEVTNGIRTYHEGEIDVVGNGHGGAAVPAGEFEAAVAADVIDAHAVDEPEPAPSTPSLSPGDVESLRFAIDASGAGEKWVRMQLIAVGLEDVPDEITDDTLGRLTVTQARELNSLLSAHVDAQELAAK